MAYVKKNWKNEPNQSTPLNAQNLNEMDNQIYDNDRAITGEKSANSFWRVSQFTGRIDWDTVNKKVTVGTGYIITKNQSYRIASAVELSYSDFNNLTAISYNITSGGVLSFRLFNQWLEDDVAMVALFSVDKIYMPFNYANVYVDGNLITTDRIFEGLSTYVGQALNEVSALSEKIDLLNPEEEIYSKEATGSNLDVNYMWVMNDIIIPANTFVTRIILKANNNTAKTFTMSYWDVSTGTKYKEKTYTITPIEKYMTIYLYENISRRTKFGFSMESVGLLVAQFTGSSILMMDKNATNLSQGTNVNKYTIVGSIYKADKGEIPEVLKKEIHVGPGLDFEEIQDAIDSITGNYATIIIHPKDTPYSRFSLMRNLSASYPWSGLSTVKHISIIGVDKEKCIIQSDTGNYDSPPAEIATNGVIENLRFIATHSASTGEETTGSYAVHVDNRPADENGMKLIFRNCDFVSYQTAAVGLGLYRNQDILFDSCNFQSNTDRTWKPSEDYNSTYMCELGAYFMHTTMGYAGGNMFIRFRNCVLKHVGGSYAMRIADADEIQTALLEAIGNTLWDEDNENPGYYTTQNPIMQMPYNHGNNASALNA